MMKKILFTGFILSLLFNSLAQNPSFEWASSMGAINYDYSYDVVIDDLGNVYTTGYFQGTVDFDPGSGVYNLTSFGTGIFIAKLDASGNFVWAKSITGTGHCSASSIALDPSGSGSVYFTGRFKGTVDFDPGSGVFNLTSIGGSDDAFICRLDTSGNFVWAKQIGGEGYCSGSSIALGSSGSGSVYFTGSFIETADFDPGAGVFNLTSTGENTDIFICKLDSFGSFIWAKQLGGADLKKSRQIIIDSNGNGDVYTTGWFQGTVDFDPDSTNNYSLTAIANYDIFISKLNSSGDFVWVRQLGGDGFNKGMSIAIDPSGNGDVYLTGAFQNAVDFDPGPGVFELYSAGDFDIFISKLNSAGNFIWAKSMGGSSYQYGFSIELDLLGNIYTTGYFRGVCDFNPDPSEIFNLTSIENDDIFISKLDNAGNFVWAKQIGGTGDDYGLSLTLNASGELLITGAYFSPEITFDMTTLTNSFSGGYTCDIFIANLKPETLGVGDEVKNENFIIYPNPVTDYLSLIFSGNIQEVEVNIIDITGKMAKIIKPESSTIYVGDLVNGIYIVELVIKGNAVSQKFVKQ